MSGIWTTAEPSVYVVDPALAAAIACYLRGRAFGLVDIGCGSGWYVNYWRQVGYCAAGYDGNPNTPRLSGGTCEIAELHRPAALGLHDYAISLEVGEHIPAEFEQTFIDNVAAASRLGAIVSWAIPGQTGIGHVNEQPNDYVIGQFERRGFRYDPSASAWLRVCATLPWFHNTVMVFERVTECPNIFTTARIAAANAM